MTKKIDSRIINLIENCSLKNERSVFIIVGDKPKEQIPNLHYLLCQKSSIEKIKKPEILWCYKSVLDLSSHQQKTLNKKSKMDLKGDYNKDTEKNTFTQFINANKDVLKQIKYDDATKILGRTYSMLILQDFEAINPNLLCKTIETVRGGGMIIFLFKGLSNLKQIHSIYMDVYNKLKTSNYKEVNSRFNERFVKSLIKDNKNFLAIDEEMNILEINKDKATEIKHLGESISDEREVALNNLKRELLSKKPIGPLVEYCVTLDQAKCVMEIVDVLSEKDSTMTVSLFAGRGRGKSAAMGIAIGSAVIFKYSSVYVTAPSPDNLQTFFEFCIKSLECLGLIKTRDFNVLYSTTSSKQIVELEIIKDFKQRIKYIEPETDVKVIENSELLIIDEAAAIPLNIVKKLISLNCTTLMASTIQGYEGTGRSLSLKLISQIKVEKKRNLKEITLEQPIRYCENDPVEYWMNKMLCLECNKDSLFLFDYPHSDECELYLVNKEILFSYKKSSEEFLNSLMSLFVSSHYKNSPNDLQILSDSTSHHIFILTKNLKKSTLNGLPEIYCAIQVAEEGGITNDVIERSLMKDNLPPGDLIPWTLSNYFLDSDFPKLKGVRVVRIASHPSAQRMGYGKKALEHLFNYYQGKMISLEEKAKNGEEKRAPLLQDLNELDPPVNYSYLGTSFGLTGGLLKFWKSSGFKPVYIKSLRNTTTGEQSCIMLRKIENDSIKLNINSTSIKSNCWLESFSVDFMKRFNTWLSYDEFRHMRIDLASEILGTSSEETEEFYGLKELELFITKESFKRLKKYSQGLLSCNLIIDLIPIIAELIFNKKVNKSVSPEQAMILLGAGLQRKSFEQIEKELDEIKKERGGKNQQKNSNFGIDQTTIMGMFKKIVIKFTDVLKKLYEDNLIKSDETLHAKGGLNNLKLNESDEAMKINPKEDLFGKDETIKSNEKKIKTEFYSKLTNNSNSKKSKKD